MCRATCLDEVVARRRHNELGLSQSVQYAVIWPVLLLSTLGIIQAGIWIHGHNVAVRAANAGADVARGSYGTSQDAVDRATALAGAGGLHEVVIQVNRQPDRVEVVVNARAPLFFDVGFGRITESASAPLERVTPP